MSNYTDFIKTGNAIRSGTANCFLRCSSLMIEDGTNANTLKCTLTNRFNGNSITETDNIVKKDATTGHFNLTAGGKQLSIENASLSGLVLWAGQVGYQNTTGNDISCRIYKSADNIKIVFFNATTGTTWDITSLVDTGALIVEIQYITDA